MPAAARLGDKAQVDADAHGCPSCPHPAVGPIVAGSPNVTINGKPAARLDDPGAHAVCCGPNNFTIVKGSPTVYVNGKPLARQNDKTKHCGGSGPIIEGSPDVLIDDGAGDGASLKAAAIQARTINLAQSKVNQKGTAKKISDTHQGGGGSASGGAGGGAAGPGGVTRGATARPAAAGPGARGPSGKPAVKPAPKPVVKHKPAAHADPKHAEHSHPTPHKPDAHKPDAHKAAPGAKDTSLSDAKWQVEGDVEPGTAVGMSVAAGAGLEGKTVHFIVEVLASGAWTEHARKSAKVAGGKAEAQVTLLHPSKDAHAPPAEVRFRVEPA